MKASNYLEDAILNYFLRGQSVQQPTQVFLALYKTNPTDNDTGAEVSGGGYARKQITFGVPSQHSERAQITNAARVEFDVATAEWGEVAYFALRDANVAGNLLVHGVFNKPTKIEEGNRFIVEAGALTVSIG